MIPISRCNLGAMLVAYLALAPKSMLACAACFGRSDSPMAQGMNMGIFTLLVVIVSVLMGIAAFFIYIIRRANRMAAQSDQAVTPPLGSETQGT